MILNSIDVDCENHNSFGVSIHSTGKSLYPDSVLIDIRSRRCSTMFHITIDEFKELTCICNSLNESLSVLYKRAKKAEERDVA